MRANRADRPRGSRNGVPAESGQQRPCRTAAERDRPSRVAHQAEVERIVEEKLRDAGVSVEGPGGVAPAPGPWQLAWLTPWLLMESLVPTRWRRSPSA
jgi:hypothetical protein